MSSLSGLIFPLLLTMAIPRIGSAADPHPAMNLDRAKGMALHMCVALQEQAEKMQRDGRPSRFMARAFAIKAGLNETESETMVRLASQMRAHTAPLDERARAIIQAARQKHPGGRLRRGEAPPPLPQELVELQRQRDSIVEQLVKDLDRELGPAGTAKLNQYLTETMLQLQSRPLRVPNGIGPLREPVQLTPVPKEGAR